MISIIINNEIEIFMKSNTINRGNRHIHTSEKCEHVIPLSGNIKIFQNGKNVDNISYNIINKIDKWHQINPSNAQYVVQFQIKKYNDNDNNIIIKNVAIQQLAELKDVLMHL